MSDLGPTPLGDPTLKPVNKYNNDINLIDFCSRPVASQLTVYVSPHTHTHTQTSTTYSKWLMRHSWEQTQITPLELMLITCKKKRSSGSAA